MPLYRPVELQERRRLKKSMLNNAFSSIAVATVTSFAATALLMFTAMPLLGIFALLFLPTLFAFYKTACAILDSSHAAAIKRQAQMRQERDEDTKRQHEQEPKLRHQITPDIYDHKPVIHPRAQTLETEPSYIPAAQTTEHRTTRSYPYPIDPYSVGVRYAAPNRLPSPSPLHQGSSNGSVHGKAPLTVSTPVPVRQPKQAQPLFPAHVQKELDTALKKQHLNAPTQPTKPVVDVDIATQIPPRDEATVERRMSAIGILEKRMQEQQREQAGKPHSLEVEIKETIRKLRPKEYTPIVITTSTAKLQEPKTARPVEPEILPPDELSLQVTPSAPLPLMTVTDKKYFRLPQKPIEEKAILPAQEVIFTAIPEALSQDDLLKAPPVSLIPVQTVPSAHIVRKSSSSKKPPLRPKPSFLDFSNLPPPDAKLLKEPKTDLPASPTIADSILKKRQSVNPDDKNEEDLEGSTKHTQENHADRRTAEATTHSPKKPLPFSADLLAKKRTQLRQPKPLQLPTTSATESDTIVESMLKSPTAQLMLDRSFNFGDQKIKGQEVDDGSWDEEPPSTDLRETSTKTRIHPFTPVRTKD